MSSYQEERIRERAHAIWLAEGQPDGRHEEHWHRAAREIAQEVQPADPPRKNPQRATSLKTTGTTHQAPRRRVAAGRETAGNGRIGR